MKIHLMRYLPRFALILALHFVPITAVNAQIIFTGVPFLRIEPTAQGILKLMDLIFDRPIISRVNDRVTITYSNASLNPESPEHSLAGTTYQDLSIQFSWR